MPKIRVGILRGGPSSEYEVSLKTGAEILKHLPTDKYTPADIFIDKQGVWHSIGLPISPAKVFEQTEVIFNALHGEYGEDGQVQKVLEDFQVPYTGSGRLASALGVNKPLAGKYLHQAGLKVPPGLAFTWLDEPQIIAQTVFRKISPPWVIKPADRGSSVGIFFADNLSDLLSGIEQALEYSNQIMVEEYIKGVEATCGVVDDFRGLNYYPLLPIEIRRPVNSSVWSYEDKYSGLTEELCPGQFTGQLGEELGRLAILAHQTLGLRHYSRSDFIVSPTRGIYILEVNTLPGLTPTSLLPKSLEAIGCDYSDFLDHLVSLALKRK
ncbi:MAG: D-alanine--D-alanine ligase family protein [Patescibacteria group bacterium]